MINTNANTKKCLTGSDDHKLYISLNFASHSLLEVNSIDISTKYVLCN